MAIATHTSGLPSLPRMRDRPLRSHYWRLWRHGENPYGETEAEVLDQARATPRRRGTFRYSNLGFELLGAAIGRAGGGTFVRTDTAPA